MKASVQYNDLLGSAAADTSDFLGGMVGDDLNAIGKYFKLNENRFKIVAVSIYGTDNFYLSLICVDLEKTTEEKEYIVKLMVNNEDSKNYIDVLFKRLNIVLHDRFDEKYTSKEYDNEANFDDFH